MPQKPIPVDTTVDPALGYLSNPIYQSTGVVGGLIEPQSNLSPQTQGNTTILNTKVVYINNIVPAAGANTDVQINVDGQVIGDSNLTFNTNTNLLTTKDESVRGNITVYGSANLGSVGSITITGGVDGDFLHTDGNGGLTWATPSDYQLQSDWNAVGGVQKILNKPILSTVAITGDYNDLANTPSIPNITDLATQTYVTNKIANVTWANLPGTPDVSHFVNSSVFDILSSNVANITWATLSGRPNFSNVALSGNYNDLANTPTIPDVSSFATTSYVQSQLSGLTLFDQSLNTTNDTVFNTVTAGVFNGSLRDYTGHGFIDLQNVTDAPDTMISIRNHSSDPTAQTILHLEADHSSSYLNLFINSGGNLTNSGDSGIIANTVNANFSISTLTNISSSYVPRTWTFDSKGNITLPSGGNINYSNGTSIISAANPFNQSLNTTDSVTFNSLTSPSIDTENIQFDNTANVTGGAIVTDDVNGQLSFGTTTGNISIWPGSSQWIFDTMGNLTLPSTTSNINYSNGVSILDGIGIAVTTSDVAPSSPMNGDLWYDTVSGRTYIWFDSSWVDSSPAGGGGISLPSQTNNAGYFLTNDGTGNLSWGTPASGGGSTYGNSNVSVYLQAYTGNITANTITTTGNITSPYFIGNGSQLTGLPAGYSNAEAASYFRTYSGNLSAGNASLGNTVTANYFVGNGSLLTGLPAGYTNSNVASYLPTYTGNITANNISVTHEILANTIRSPAGTNADVVMDPDGFGKFIVTSVTPVEMGNSLSVTGNIEATTITTGTGTNGNLTIHPDGSGKLIIASTTPVTMGNTLSVTGNITAGNSVTSNYFIGNLYGIANVANAVAWANVTNKPTTLAGYGITDSYGNTNVANYLPTYSGALSAVSSINATGTIIGNNVQVANNLTLGGYFTLYGSNLTIASLNGSGITVANNFIVSANANVSGNLKTNTNLSVGGYANIIGNATITGNTNLSNVALTGNVTTDLNVSGNVVGGGVRSTTSSTKPTNPIVGDIWYNTTTDTTYRYTNDGATSYWLDISGPAIVTSSTVPIVRGYLNAGVPISIDNLRIQMATSGNRSLQIASVSGLYSVMVGAYASYVGSGTNSIAYFADQTIAVTPTFQNISTWSFPGAGDTGWYHINDITNSRFYRVTFMVGGSYNNNFISIERLI